MLRFVSLSLVLLIVVLIFLPVIKAYDSEKYYAIYGEHRQIDMRPLGELTSEKQFRQRLPSISTKKLSDIELQNQLCVELYLATYGDRENSGTVNLTLALDNQAYQQDIAMSEVADNAYHRICFDNLLIRDFTSANQIEIVVSGVDGPPGSSITAWTTTDTRYGSFSPVLSDEPDRSLIFTFGYLAEQPDAQIRQSIILAVIYFLSILVLAWPLLMHRDKN